MSHSKCTKKGHSLYVEKWNPYAKKYINVCPVCGKQGYSPSIEEADFQIDLEREAIYKELTKMFDSALAVDSYGRCEDCAKRQEQ